MVRVNLGYDYRKISTKPPYKERRLGFMATTMGVVKKPDHPDRLSNWAGDGVTDLWGV